MALKKRDDVKMIIVVRWKDNNGKSHKKEYDQYKQAIKARNYLVKNGATDVDMAVSNRLQGRGVLCRIINIRQRLMRTRLLSRVRIFRLGPRFIAG